VSMQKDIIRTRLAVFDTAKPFISLTEILFKRCIVCS